MIRLSSGSRLSFWGEKGFIDILRVGEKHGLAILPDNMPRASYRYMSDLELRAGHQYLTSQPAKDFGSR